MAPQFTLRASAPDALLEAIFQHAPVGMGFWDASLRCVRINEALAAINGVPAAETVGRTMPEVLGPLGEQLEALFRQILDDGVPRQDLVIRGQTLAVPGVDRHWLASYFPVSDADGRRLGVAAHIHEVTEAHSARARADDALTGARAATALLDAVYAAIPVGLAFLSPDGRFQRVNQALAEMNGRAVEEHLGRTVEEVLGAPGERIAALVRTVVETRGAVADDEIAVEGDRYWEASYFPVFGADDELEGVGAVVREITERHRAELERTTLLKEAVTARAHAEAAQVRAEAAQQLAEEARARTEFLAEAGRRMAVSLDYEWTLQQVAEIAVPVVADWCVITLAEAGGRARTVAAARAGAERTGSAQELADRYAPVLSADTGIGRVVRTGEMQLLNDVTDETLAGAAHDDEHLRTLRELDMRAVLIMPLRTPERILGALTLIFSESGRRFGHDDIALATSLAARAALHVRNGQLYRERSHIARTLQAGLLPRRLPDIDHLEVAARYRAAGDENDVGGDFYDVFPTGKGTWAAVIGDVSGKGPEAAAVTSLTRHTLRTSALHNSAPAANLAVLNRALLAESDVNRFCTVVYARVCPGPDGLDVTMASAGHPPPLLIRPGGEVQRLEVRGTIVGVLADPEFGECEVRLESGDALLVYTDGVIELRTTEWEYGERRLLEVAGEHADRSADEIADAVLRMAVEAQDGEPRDDIALLCLKQR
jgi:PAS domain S-box-containing protein